MRPRCERRPTGSGGRRPGACPAPKRARPWIACLASVLLASCAAAPRELGDLRAGTRVRGTYAAADARVVAAELVRQVNGSIEVLVGPDAPPSRISLHDLSLLEALHGRALGSGALLGGALGGAAGLIGGMVCLAVCSTDNDDRILAPLIGIGAGTTAGALGGVLLAPERWIVIRIR